MREKRIFGERTSFLPTPDFDARKKFFLVYEGSKTEGIYFEAVNELRKQVGINPLIELVPTVRDYSEFRDVNPVKIVNNVMRKLRENKQKEISYRTVLDRIMFELQDYNLINRSYQRHFIWKGLENFCINSCSVDNLESYIKEDIDIFVDRLIHIVKKLLEELRIDNIVLNKDNIIKSDDFTYCDGFDRICFIFDRDRKSFVVNSNHNQYKYVLEKCKENNFDIYVSNPCFEFWLLLHYDKVFELDRAKLYFNEKENNKTYAEIELHKLDPDYNKGNYYAKKYVDVIDVAIRNEKSFCENIEKLEYNIGSNIGLLIQRLKDG